MKLSWAIVFTVFMSFFFSVNSCRKAEELLPEEGEQYSGGTGTVFNSSPLAFTQEISNLSASEGLLFFVGNSFFNQNWVSAPASTTARDGLGPLFNARSCSSCHSLDGRGTPPQFTGDEGKGLLLRLGINGTDEHGGPLGDPIYGGQLQDGAIQGINAEGKLNITYYEMEGQYADGTTYRLRKPIYSITELQYGNLAATQISPRIATQMPGIGLLEAVPATTILAMVDEGDANGDGISGKANMVWDAKSQQTMLGRFGWKANQPTVYQQTCGAFLGDLGITTSLFPAENYGAIPNGQNLPNGGAPEIPEDDLEKVVLYSSVLAVPARRNWDDKNVLEGKQLFTNLGCDKCHTPKLQTGTHPIAALSNQTIRPYTDLLLHDMGPGLADNYKDYLANGNEWRTQPLWGLGLIGVVNGHTNLLHDGRARNVEEAILWHAGEAEQSKNSFKQLSKTEREKLLAFLNSL